MDDINTTVHAIIKTVRDNMAGPFDLNKDDEFIDTIAAFVTNAIGRDRNITQAHVASIARREAWSSLMIAPCDRCQEYTDIDKATNGDGLLCDACRAALVGTEVQG